MLSPRPGRLRPLRTSVPTPDAPARLAPSALPRGCLLSLSTSVSIRVSVSLLSGPVSACGVRPLIEWQLWELDPVTLHLGHCPGPLGHTEKTSTEVASLRWPRSCPGRLRRPRSQ